MHKMEQWSKVDRCKETKDQKGAHIRSCKGAKGEKRTRLKYAKTMPAKVKRSKGAKEQKERSNGARDRPGHPYHFSELK